MLDKMFVKEIETEQTLRSSEIFGVCFLMIFERLYWF